MACLLAAALQSHPDELLPAWSRSLTGTFQEEPTTRRQGQDLTVNVGAHVRYAIPFGSADRSAFVYGPNVVVVDQSLSWSDFFDGGWGYDLEVDVFLGSRASGPERSPGMSHGIVVLLQGDEFGGRHLDGALGNSVKLDDLAMYSFLVGGKVVQTFEGGLYVDGYVAIGVVHYRSVDGTFSGPALAEFRDEVLKDTWTFASAFRVHGGLRLGPLGFVLGLGLRVQAPPSEGGRISMDSGAFWTFDLDLGVELGF